MNSAQAVIDAARCAIRSPDAQAHDDLRDALIAYDRSHDAAGDEKPIDVVEWGRDDLRSTARILRSAIDKATLVARSMESAVETPAELHAHGLAGEAKSLEPSSSVSPGQLEHRAATSLVQQSRAGSSDDGSATELSKPAFKVGDRVRDKATGHIATIEGTRQHLGDDRMWMIRGPLAKSSKPGEPHVELFLYADDIEPVEPSKPAGERPGRECPIARVTPHGEEPCCLEDGHREDHLFKPSPSPRAEVEIPEEAIRAVVVEQLQEMCNKYSGWDYIEVDANDLNNFVSSIRAALAAAREGRAS